MSTPRKWKRCCSRIRGCARRPCCRSPMRAGDKSASLTWRPTPPRASCASSCASALRATKCPRASWWCLACSATQPERWTASRWRGVLLQQRPELRPDVGRLARLGIDGDVHRGRCGEVLLFLAEEIVLEPEAALADPPHREPHRDELPDAEGPLEGRLGVTQRQNLLALAEELLQRHAAGAEKFLEGFVAVDEDVGEEDDPRRIGMLEADPELVLECGHARGVQLSLGL